MRAFLKTKAGVFTLCLFMLGMSAVFYHVQQRRRAREAAAAAAAQAESTTSGKNQGGTAQAQNGGADVAQLQRNAAYLDRYYALSKQSHEEHDRQGVPVTHRITPNTPADAGRVTINEQPQDTTAALPPPPRISLRLHGRSPAQSSSGGTTSLAQIQQKVENLLQPPAALTNALKQGSMPVPPSPQSLATAAVRPKPKRFNPYGNPIECELVFTIDSTNENTPFVGLVTKPVWNNGQLVIPAGAELHGVARPDRLRDRIFSGQDWVLVFPREHGKPNGRQLNVKGVALDHLERDANGMTWGITDGSYGLEGKVIRSNDQEEIKRFAATAIAAAAQTLQEQQTTGLAIAGSNVEGINTVKNTPRNAVLQGIATDMQKLAEDISAEISRNGVFIRVGAGHQFYFYPMQIIDPDVADISSDIATVK